VKAGWQLLTLVLLLGCGPDPFPPGSTIAGTWGTNGAGLMADDTSAHVHIQCTYGNVHQPIVTDQSGEFDLPGEYNVRAYPVDAGIFHPARFAGTVQGRKMTLTVQLTDTAVTLGPVTLTFEVDPVMGPCPICVGPRARAEAAARR
jgi:hypothetical protein